MKKLIFFKAGFTLIEMVLVIAIIVILASVVIFATAGYLNKTNSAKAKVDSHNLMLSSENALIDAHT